MWTRRHILKTGAWAGTHVALLSGVSGCQNDTNIPPVPSDSEHNYRNLSPRDRAILSAIAPVILEGALPEEKQERSAAIRDILRQIDVSIGTLPDLTQQDVQKLLSVLDSGYLLSLTPRILTGVPGDWNDTTAIQQFLDEWRFSDPDHWITGNELRAGYLALFELTTSSWYSNPRTWKLTGYGGPPPLA